MISKAVFSQGLPKPTMAPYANSSPLHFHMLQDVQLLWSSTFVDSVEAEEAPGNMHRQYLLECHMKPLRCTCIKC
jgi:hypothetical protein